MILGQNAFFVTPCDSLAVLANNLQLIPYFQKVKHIHLIRIFLGLLNPDPLVGGMDQDPDPSNILLSYSSSKNSKKNLDSYCFVISLGLFLSLNNDVNVQSKSNKQKNSFKKLVFCWRLEGQ